VREKDGERNALSEENTEEAEVKIQESRKEKDKGKGKEKMKFREEKGGSFYYGEEPENLGNNGDEDYENYCSSDGDLLKDLRLKYKGY